MSTFFSARKLAEMSLQLVQEFALNDAGADGGAVERTLEWMDVNLAQLSGTERLLWLIPTTLEIPLTSGTASYDIETVLGSAAPDGWLCARTTAAALWARASLTTSRG